GYRRMTIFLNHYLNARVNHKCVYRLMRLLELKAVIRRKRYTYKPHKPQHLAENILNRAFQEKYKKMEVLLTDITEFKYGVNSKAYFSAILDYGENKIIAYKLSKHNNNALVRDTMTQIENDIIPTKTLFHSDRGFQYTSHSFKQFIEKHQIIQSMSRVGRCIDNGPMENFWGIIRSENKIIAYKLSKHNNNALVRDTMTQIENDIIPTKTLFHSDRGFQYTSHSFKQFIEKHQIIQSMSRVGRCIDNGPMENFWGII